MTDPTPQFLDVATLLDRSHPRQRVNHFWYLIGMFLLVTLVGSYFGASSPAIKSLVESMSVLLMVGLLAAMWLLTYRDFRTLRDAQRQIEAAQELVQLRRWTEAGVLLTQILSRPVRTAAMRVEALLCLVGVMARYHRFNDAITVQTHLLELPLDENTQRAIKTGRAMAMLREDHLFDADQAISDLRRGDGRESAALGLVEMYRDVKTGHPAEAAATFAARLPILRDQLGHRVADAWALVAGAFNQLGQGDDARKAWHRATLLMPGTELIRRYPELASVGSTYPSATRPGEVA